MRHLIIGANYYKGPLYHIADAERGTDNSSVNPSDKSIGEILTKRVFDTSIEPGLHIVSTPIGNLSDITLRAIAVLQAADAIACEDTRVTRKLKTELRLSAPLISYHEHNADKATSEIIERLKSGEIVALVSDAGTPLVSDPGYRLVNATIDENLTVIPVPGASALLAALSASGLPTDRFLFEGFLPKKTNARHKLLQRAALVNASIVFFESPKRLTRSLLDMVRILGNRQAIIARELTKRYEEISRGPLATLIKNFESTATLRGEITIVVAPPLNKGAPPPADLDKMLMDALSEYSTRDAVTTIAAETGLQRRSLYQRALQLGVNDD
ncbi:MAG: 16S rRNA (cytidine(1402)-2'-O)-methyltransferase [Pseudomonadota bacterium]|nr:16S rRNA (cytidine(1402)-2'-O)-methyltransferase [Pseudomonadota bacterium]